MSRESPALRQTARLLFTVVAALTAGCFKSAPIDGSGCPCPAGYVCCPATQLCQQPGGACAMGADAAVDDGSSGALDALSTDANPPGEAGPISVDEPGPGPVRRLNRFELANTLRDLLGETRGATVTADLASDWGTSGGFAVGAAVLNDADARQIMALGESVATAAATRLATLVPCQPFPTTRSDEDACAQRFIAAFAPRAFRRPLSDDERTSLLTLYATARGADVQDDFPNALRLVIEALIESPYFLYRWELGPPATKEGKLVRFDAYQMASRLSYGLWATMPDDRLFSEAAQGALSTPDQLEAEARRMLADPRAQQVLHDFHFQWLALDRMPGMAPDPSDVLFTPAVAQAMLDETDAFVSDVFRTTGKLDDLLTSSDAFVDTRLAPLYGVAPPAGNQLERVPLDPTRRAGLFTHLAFLAANPQLVTRGMTVLERVLCRQLPDVPPDIVVPVPPDAIPGQTTRQRFEQVVDNPCTNGCHVIYPLGYAFLNYDDIGVYRTLDSGQMIDASGSVPLAAGDFTYPSAVGLFKKLAQEDEVRACMGKLWFRYLVRRLEVPGDQASLSTAATAFARSSYDLRELIVALVRSRAFSLRTPSPGEVLP